MNSTKEPYFSNALVVVEDDTRESLRKVVCSIAVAMRHTATDNNVVRDFALALLRRVRTDERCFHRARTYPSAMEYCEQWICIICRNKVQEPKTAYRITMDDMLNDDEIPNCEKFERSRTAQEKQEQYKRFYSGTEAQAEAQSEEFRKMMEDAIKEINDRIWSRTNNNDTWANFMGSKTKDWGWK